MTPAAIFVALVTVVALGLLISGIASLDLVGLGLVILLAVSGIISLGDALGGFSNDAVITLAGLYVIGEGLSHTGALNFVAHHLLDLSKGNHKRLLYSLCTLAALISGLASNTAVVLVFLPLAVEIARRLEVEVSRILMPMAFSSILGGTLTLVGSTTNLLTSGSGVQAGAEPLGLFTMTPIAVVLCIVGVPLSVILTERLLPTRRTLTTSLAGTPMREFVTELTVGPDSPLVGQELQASFQSAEADGAKALMIARDGDVLWPPYEHKQVESGDTIMLRGKVERLLALQESLGLEFLGDTRFDPRTMQLFELVLAPSSALVGIRLGDLHLWRDFGVLVVAVLRGDHHYRQLASNLHLRPGDVLLVCGPESSEAKIERSQDFYRIATDEHNPLLKQAARRSLQILGAVIALFLLGTVPALKAYMPIPLVVLAGAIAMVGARCINTRRAYRCIGWPVLIFVVGALALGEAMVATGLSDAIASGIVGGMSAFGAGGTLAGLLLAGTLLNQVVSPYAVSVLLAPIAISTAHSLGIPDATPFVLAVAFAGSNAFATPLGHQVNLLVLGPGGYRYSDFLRVGAPLAFVYWLIASFGLSLYL